MRATFWSTTRSNVSNLPLSAKALLLLLAGGSLACPGASEPFDAQNLDSGVSLETGSDESETAEEQVETPDVEPSMKGDDGPPTPMPTPETEEDDGGEEETAEPPRFDVTFADAGDGIIEGDPTLEFSYIWISNSSQSTVSKIETSSLKEVGRFLTREDEAGDPSRTSVGPTGDVVVANRSGGVTKFYANPEDCKDRNGKDGIQSSSGEDWLPWDEEECRAWYVPFDYESQRAVAWTKGEWDPKLREFNNVKVWVSGAKSGVSNQYILDVLMLDGEDGKLEKIVQIDMQELESEVDIKAYRWGAYGGVVDRDSNFWFTNVGAGSLVKVSYEDFSVKSWKKTHSSYGITADSKGRIWTCGSNVGRFDPETETWTVVKDDLGESSGEEKFQGAWGEDTGCMSDGEGRLWVSVHKNGKAVYGIDLETLEAVAIWPIPDQARGISVDFEGYVWGVAEKGSEAYRIDPDTGEYETITGLVDAYTYSDMTGFALSATILPPAQ